MFSQRDVLKLVNNISFQKPYGRSWVSFFNNNTQEIQIFDPINLEIIQYIKIEQKISDYEFSYDYNQLIVRLNKRLLVQDLKADIKSYYNHVKRDEWKTFKNELWIQQNNKLQVIKDHNIVSSKIDQIKLYSFGLKLIVQTINHDCFNFINNGKSKIKYFLKAKQFHKINYRSNINYWGFIEFNEFGKWKSIRILNKLNQYIKLSRKQPFLINILVKIIKLDIISVVIEKDDGVLYFKLFYATNGRVKRFKWILELENITITNDLKTLLYLQNEKYIISSFKP